MIVDVWAEIWSTYLLHAEGEHLNQVVCCFVTLPIKRQNDLTCHSQFHMPLQLAYSGQWTANTYIMTYPSANRRRHKRWADVWISDSTVVIISMWQFGQRRLAGFGPKGKAPVRITGRQSCKSNIFSQYHHVSTLGRYY